MVCGLVAATLAVLLYGLSLGAQSARAGTPAAWQAAQAASTAASATAVPAQGVELYPTDTAPATAQAAAAPVVKSPQMVVDDQTAGAQTSVTQQQPTNVVISIRIDSPGDNGPISQTNVAVGAANGTNDASTGQNGVPGGAGQDASTDQQADANTTATQDQAGNYVVTVRINSPGNNGPVSQTNAAAGSSNAQNSSETSQGGQSQAPAQSMAPTKAAGSTRHASHRRPQHTSAAPAAAAAVSATLVAPAPAWHSSGAKPTAAVRAHHPSHTAAGRAAHRGTATHRGRDKQASASPLGKAISDAGDLLGAVAPHAPIGTAQRSADVSSSVLYSLLAVLGVTAVFVAWSLRPAWRRQRRSGSWLLR